MGSQDRPSFFCSRPDGTLTPLLAVDDLPLSLSVRNVSRTLTPGDTQGMTSCGVAAPRSDPWVVDGPPTGSRVVNDEKMNDLHALLFKILREEEVGCEIRSSIQEILFRGFDTQSSVPLPAPSAIVAACQTPQVAPHFRYGGNFQGGNPQGNHKHPHNKKQYCSYWIRHGECDYSQQGCLYKHEMPMDLVLLDKLGLRDIPRWYREKYGVTSLLQSSYSNNRGQNQYQISEHAHQLVHQPTQQPAQRSLEWSPSAETPDTREHRTKQGRYKSPKSPRGPGFQSGKSRGNYTKGQGQGRGQQHHGYINLFEMTPTGSTTSPETSEDSFIMTSGPLDATDDRRAMDASRSLDAIRSTGATGATDAPRVSVQQGPGRVSSQGSQSLLDKEGRATKKFDPTAQMAKLTTNEPIDGYPKNIFRTKSRRPYEYGGDSQLKSPITSNATRPSTAGREPVIKPEQRRNLYSTLLSNSEPIHPRDMEFTFGAIGEPVLYPNRDTEFPSSNDSASTSIFVGNQQFFVKTDKKKNKHSGRSDNV
ncbi:Zinc finger CCCH-type [Penicillium cinerascens]|uniref:Zinc finger CCCH-type n=1 Tax=Penicillium cinerascens TaxID=70096 RepID=A0A9W9M6E7_9EURO|nr:Zinc finger CCCH-type [Penicillium cinerascens]KAJ5190449.1 Zinc finger CCCH-type [Penicillium cinerascens]